MGENKEGEMRDNMIGFLLLNTTYIVKALTEFVETLFKKKHIEEHSC